MATFEVYIAECLNALPGFTEAVELLSEPSTGCTYQSTGLAPEGKGIDKKQISEYLDPDWK